MATRREFVKGAGLSALTVGMLGPSGIARLASAQGLRGQAGLAPGFGALGRPFNTLGDEPVRMLDGLPYLAEMTGDWPERMPHPPIIPVNEKRAPDEEVDVVVIGGGISGLTAAYLLRDHAPVVLEFMDRFGGNAQGEVWNKTPYSLGSAYIITPDAGGFLDQIYTELGLPGAARVDSDGIRTPMELGGEIPEDFWDGHDLGPKGREAFDQYAQIVMNMAYNEYPEIPLPEHGAEGVRDLDRVSLKEDILSMMTVPVPRTLESAIQSYCYSSFSAGWEEISAASGWNFVAAEEFGRLVFPGGNTYIADRLWQLLAKREARLGGPGTMLRPGSRVDDVRLDGDGALITYHTKDLRRQRTIRAKRVVMSAPKFVAKYILHDIEKIDPAKLHAMHQIEYRAYVVVNVLVNKRLERDFYDIFLLGDGAYPRFSDQAVEFSRPTDVLSGHWNVADKRDVSVLTLYWPLPWPAARFTLAEPANKDPLAAYAERLSPRLDEILALLNLKRSDVEQVRFSRWGHAMPLSKPNLIADGVAEDAFRPFEGIVHFVQQDDWALPAVENSMLDAESAAMAINAALTTR